VTRPKLVVADDDSPTRRGYARVLRRRGFDVVEAEDGGVARDRIEEADPDVVVLDVDMPVQRGDALLSSLRRSHPALSVIIVTGETDPALGPRLLELGAAAFLTKPVTADDLVAAVEAALDAPADRDPT